MQGCHRSHQCSIPPAARGCRPSRDPRGRPRGLLPSKIPRRRWTRERPASPLLSRRIGPTRESQHRCARNELRWLRGWPGRVSVFPRDGNRATTGRRASAPRSLRDRSRDDDGGGGDWQRWRGSGTDHGAQHHMSRGDEPGGLGRGAPRSGRLGRLGRSDGERRRAGADRAGKTRGCGIVARQRTAHGWPSWNRDCSDAARPNGPPPPLLPLGFPVRRRSPARFSSLFVVSAPRLYRWRSERDRRCARALEGRGGHVEKYKGLSARYKFFENKLRT